MVAALLLLAVEDLDSGSLPKSFREYQAKDALPKRIISLQQYACL